MWRRPDATALPLGLFPLDPKNVSAEGQLKSELRYWSCEDLERFNRACAAGLRRWPWQAVNRIPGKTVLEFQRLVRRFDACTAEREHLNLAEESVEMPVVFAGIGEKKFFPATPLSPRLDPVKRHPRAVLLVDESGLLQTLNSTTVLGGHGAVDDRVPSILHELVSAHVKRVATIAISLALERRKNNGASFTEQLLQLQVTPRDVRNANAYITQTEVPEGADTEDMDRRRKIRKTKTDAAEQLAQTEGSMPRVSGEKRTEGVLSFEDEVELLEDDNGSSSFLAATAGSSVDDLSADAVTD